MALVSAAAIPSVQADCAPPCGPIPVYLEIDMGPKKNYAFSGEEALVLEGKVSVYIDVDNDGFWYDPQNQPKLTFRVNKQPPWVQTAVEPSEYDVPISDGRYVTQGEAPGQFQYYWEAPLKFTIKHVRDPTPEELSKGSKFVRPDGTYRILVSASTTSSVLAPDVFGPNMGLQEGYGVKEVRMIPEVAGVAWVPNAEGVLMPSDGVLPQDAKGAAPSPLAPMALLAGLGLAVLLRRRRA